MREITTKTQSSEESVFCKKIWLNKIIEYCYHFSHFKGIEVIPIATGNEINQANLEMVASDPSHIFVAEDLQKITIKINEIVNKSCERKFRIQMSLESVWKNESWQNKFSYKYLFYQFGKTRVVSIDLHRKAS